MQGNPLNSSDPTGLDNCGPFALFCDAVATAANAVGSQAVSWAGDIHNALPNCARNPFGGDNGNGGCESYLSTSQGVTGIGIALGAGATVLSGGALAGVSAFGMERATSSLVIGGAGLTLGGGAVGRDWPECQSGSVAAGAVVAPQPRLLWAVPTTPSLRSSTQT